MNANQETHMKPTGIWAVELTEAHPDWKRPYADFAVKYFASEKLAKEYKEKMMQEKLKQYRKWVDDETYTPQEEFELIENYGEVLYRSQGYMDMLAFDVVAYEIKIPAEDAKIEEKSSLQNLK